MNARTAVGVTPGRVRGRRAGRMFILLLLAAAGPARAEVLALTGGRIVPVAGPPIEQGVLLIADGRISALGARLAVPPGARVIDVSGQTVYPGLLDASTNVGLMEISAVAASVDTTEVGDVNPHAQAWLAVNPHSEAIPVARANGVTAVLSAPAGGLISGQSAWLRLAGSTPDALLLHTPAAVHMNFPDGRPAQDAGRASDEPEPKSVEERLKEKRENQARDLRRLGNLLAEARAYAAAAEAARRGNAPPPGPDPALAALAPAALGRVPVVMVADEEQDIRRAVAFAAEHGLRLVVGGGLEAWRCAELLREKDVPVLVKVLRLPRRESDPYDAAFANAAALHQAGVRFAIVTDDTADVRNLPYEAAMARAFGLPAEAALRAITLAPAEIFGLAARLGSLEAGKDAHVVVASGDIMDARTQVLRVFVDGVEQPLATRHTRLYEAFKDRRLSK